MNIKIIVNYVLVFCLLFIPAYAAGDTNSDDIVLKNMDAAAIETARRSKEGLQQNRDRIKEERKILKLELRKLREAEKELGRGLDLRKKTFSSLLEEEKKLTNLIEFENQEIKAVDGTVLNYLKEAEEMIKSSAVSIEMGSVSEQLRVLKGSRRGPGMDDIKNLADRFRDLTLKSSEVDAKKGTYTGVDGRDVSGYMIRSGLFSTTCIDNSPGFLLPDQSGKKMIRVKGNIPSESSSLIEKFIENGNGVLPVDISQGTVFKLLRKKRDLVARVRAGGLLVWPIILAGISAFVLIAVCGLRLGRVHIFPEPVFEKVKETAVNESMEKARLICPDAAFCPSSTVVEKLLTSPVKTRDVIENTIEEAIMCEMPRLTRFLSTIKVLASVAPLLGLLGTVTGMIHTFQMISIFGTGDPRLMSGGISEALITTQLGLMVAVPVMICHHFLEKKVNGIEDDMEEKAAAMTVTILSCVAERRRDAAA